MTGAITGRQVLGYPILVARGWGILTLLRCLSALALRRRYTFLDLIAKEGDARS